MPGLAATAAPFPGSSQEAAADRPARTERLAASNLGPASELLLEFVRFAGWRQLAAAGALIVVGTALEGVGILLLVQLFQFFLGAPADPWRFDGLDRETWGLIGFAAFGVLIVARGVVLTTRDTLVARLQHGFVETTKARLFERIAFASWTSVIKVDQARLVQMLGSEIVEMTIAVRSALQASGAAVMLLGLAVFAVTLAPGLFVITLAFVATVGLATTHFMRRSSRFGRSQLQHDLSMAETSARFLGALKFAKAQGVQGLFLDRHAAASRASVDRRMAFVRTVSVSRNVVTITAALAAAAAILVGIGAFEVSAPTLIAFALVLSRMTSPALVVQEGLQQVAHNVPRFELLRSLGADLAPTLSVVQVDEVGTASARGCSVLLEDVSFHRSPGGAQGVFDARLAIAAGELVGIAGPSGSGKTTLLDLIAGLIEPDVGECLLDGRVASALAGCHHRERLSYVGQEPILFAGSLRDNLRWSAPAATDRDIWRALDLVGAAALVRRGEEGLDARLADEGNNLSAGERQRLALAAALLRRPALLLLDEATSSLDAASERAVIEGIRGLRPRPTILLVSHRAESLAMCERIVTLAEGMLVDDRTLPSPQLTDSLNQSRRIA